VAEIGGKQRYGESVVREVLGARFLAEEVLEPAVALVGASDADATSDADVPSDADAPPEQYPYDSGPDDPGTDEPRDE